MRIEQPEKLHRRPVPLPAGAVIGEQPVHVLPRRGRQVRSPGELPRARDQLPVAIHQEQHRALAARPPFQRLPFRARRPDRLLLRQQPDDLLRFQLERRVDRLDRRRPLPGVVGQNLHQLLGGVGEHHRTLPRPADLDVEGGLVGERAVARIQHRDHPFRRAPLLTNELGRLIQELSAASGIHSPLFFPHFVREQQDLRRRDRLKQGPIRLFHAPFSIGCVAMSMIGRVQAGVIATRELGSDDSWLQPTTADTSAERLRMPGGSKLLASRPTTKPAGSPLQCVPMARTVRAGAFMGWLPRARCRRPRSRHAGSSPPRHPGLRADT